MKIVLASGSPRRRELFRLITEDFEIRVTNCDETIPESISAENAAEYLSVKKALAAVSDNKELIIGCDTAVVIDNQILGNPSSEEECRYMLTQLSGRTHTVFTGISMIYGGSRHSYTTATDVVFYNISENEISEYIKTGEPFDKAGGYGIQGKGSLFVRKIHGDYFNVVGLPVSSLKRELESFINKIKI